MTFTKLTSLMAASAFLTMGAAWADHHVEGEQAAEDTTRVLDEVVTEEVVDTRSERVIWLDTERCKRRATTGSRVRATKECHTNREWEMIRDANIEILNEMTRSTAANSQ